MFPHSINLSFLTTPLPTSQSQLSLKSAKMSQPSLMIDGKIIIEDGFVYPWGKGELVHRQQQRKPTHRRAACTHMRIERVYGRNKCPSCHRVPDFGWLYQCMEDHDCPPPAEMTAAPEPLKGGPTEISFFAPPIPPLKLPIESIANKLSANPRVNISDYTAEHVELLAVQRAIVTETIIKTRRDVEAEAPMSYHRFVGLPEPPVPSPFTRCSWRSCHNCRPSSVERSYISLDTALVSDFGHISLANTVADRRVSDARIVRKLGLRQPPARWADNEGWASDSSDGAILRGSDDGDLASKGFRASIRKAFRGMLLNRSKYASGTVAAENGLAAPTDGEASPPTEQTAAIEAVEDSDDDDDDDDSDDFDIDLWVQLNDELLEVASSVRLPEHEGEVEELEGTGFGAEPVDVEGGVAVTEEAVEEQTADILTQA